MPYKVLFTRVAQQDVEKQSVVVRRQLYKKLVYFATLPDIKTVAKKLHNHDAGEYRLRVGNFRIIFDLDKHSLIILRIQHRKDVYR
jgi:mRNA interferase RelE/StbE